MNYEITIKCVNEPPFSEKLAKGIKRSVGAQSFYHAAFDSVEPIANEILEIDHPKDVFLEITVVSETVEKMVFRVCVTYEPFEWEKIHGEGCPILDESGVEPYTYEFLD